jgi:omega-6 fatty acid desaturase (delta-12 desaturase)
VQHQFPEAVWAPHDEHSFEDASLRGSSRLLLPQPLAWFTANIGIHHLHHLDPRVPSYRLPACDRAHPQLRLGPTFTLWQALRLAHGDLWDVRAQRLIPFAQHTGRR